MKPHIRKARGNHGRWIVSYAGEMAWAATFADACALAREHQ